MSYLNFRNNLKDFLVFSLSDIYKMDSEFDSRRLVEWQNKGYLKKLRRGYYMFSDLSLTQEMLFAIANRLYTPSYVSLELALSYYGLIPEGVYQLSSVSSRKTAKFETPIGQFSYQSLKSNLLFGYDLLEQGGYSYKIASREKTVLDYLYLHPQITQENDFREWRFNSQEFLQTIKMARFLEYANNFGSQQFVKQAKLLIDRMRQEK